MLCWRFFDGEPSVSISHQRFNAWAETPRVSLAPQGGIERFAGRNCQGITSL